MVLSVIGKVKEAVVTNEKPIRTLGEHFSTSLNTSMAPRYILSNVKIKIHPAARRFLYLSHLCVSSQKSIIYRYYFNRDKNEQNI